MNRFGESQQRQFYRNETACASKSERRTQLRASLGEKDVFSLFLIVFGKFS